MGDVFSRLKLAWIMPALVVALLANWSSLGGISQIATVRKLIPICILWCPWQERNERTFEDKEGSMEEL